VVIGGPTSSGSPTPTLNEFVSQGSQPRGARQDEALITGPMMLQYLMAMLAGRGGNIPLHGLMPLGEGGQPGQMGDYVFNQEALDQIITNLMENANSSRPVPATEQIITDLPREVLEDGSATLEKDCAVCKDQFTVTTEDPDEQVVVELPCKHIFHEGCIIPWLKSSGTCPVCRHALVPQPEHHGPGSPGTSSGGSGTQPPGGGSPRQSSSPRESGASGFFGSLFGHGQGGGSAGNGSSRSGHNASSTSHRRSRSAGAGEPRPPGGWNDSVD